MGLSSITGGLWDTFTGKGAADEAAATEMALARESSGLASFKPYSITSGFGKSFFDTEKGTAGYELDPRLAAFRDQLYGEATKTLTQLGSTDPEAEAQKYVSQQMGLLAPTRQAEDVANRLNALGSGRIGLGVSSGYVGGEGTGLLNPDQFATQLARERANAEIAAAGTTYGQNIYDQLIKRGTGMLTTGLSVEELGMNPLKFGTELGTASSNAGFNAGQLLLKGGLASAESTLAGGAAEAKGLQGAITSAMGMF